MPNYKQAPKLYHNKTHFSCKNYYNLPQDLMDCVFKQLDGKCGNQIKLMTVLLGTLGNGSFGVSEAWICERTGMVQQTYSTARKALIERGWIYIEDGNMFVLPSIIKYGFHYPEGATEEERKNIRIGTISHCVNDIKKQYQIAVKTQGDIVPKGQYDIVPKTQYDIVYNKIITNKETNNNGVGISSPNGADSPTLDDNFQVDGEITQKEADRICEKTMISPNLLLTTTGKYFRIRG